MLIIRNLNLISVQCLQSSISAFFQQIIVDKKCMKFDYGEAGNRQHYHQVHELQRKGKPEPV